MALDPKSLAKGAEVGVLDRNGGKHRATFNKINKGGTTVNVTLEKTGKPVDVPAANLRGLQGRPSTGAAPAAKATPAPSPAPKAPAAKAPAAKTAPAPAASKKNVSGLSHAEIVEKLSDRYSQIAELMNTIPDLLLDLHKFSPEEAAPAKGKPAPMEDDANFD